MTNYEILKRLVRAYPNESLSRQALIKAKEIAIDLVKVQEFEKDLSRLLDNETLSEETNDLHKIEVTEDLDAIKIKDLEDELKRTKRDLVESNS